MMKMEPRIKKIHTNWIDVIISESSDCWCSKIPGGYSREINYTSFDVIGYGVSPRTLNNINGEYVYVTEMHQVMTPETAVPSLNLLSDDTISNNNNKEFIYLTKIIKIISFSNEDDAIIYKLSIKNNQ